jgi:K+-transporting ATPase KdpF subunit
MVDGDREGLQVAKSVSILGKTALTEPSATDGSPVMRPMSFASVALVLAVVGLVIYLLATLIFPERF